MGRECLTWVGIRLLPEGLTISQRPVPNRTATAYGAAEVIVYVFGSKNRSLNSTTSDGNKVDECSRSELRISYFIVDAGVTLCASHQTESLIRYRIDYLCDTRPKREHHIHSWVTDVVVIYKALRIRETFNSPNFLDRQHILFRVSPGDYRVLRGLPCVENGWG